MFEPITLPMARSVFFLRAAIADVASSGRDVPSATTVTPMTDSLIPQDFAIVTALFTISSPPTTRPAKPIIISNIDFHIGIA